MEEAWELAALIMVSRHVPEAVKRSLHEECGYRCSVPTCRETSALQFEHIEDWSKLEPKRHEFDKMIVLCATCHARVTSGEIAKDSIRAYKRNLAIVSGRYSLFEMRLLEAFNENKTTLRSEEYNCLFVDDHDNLSSPQTKLSEAKELISSTDSLHIKGLVDDGLVEAKKTVKKVFVGKLDLSPYEVSLTNKGKVFLGNYFSGKEVEN